MTPELWSAAWFSALMSIVLIDLVLAGDNAIVIGLAARNVPAHLQRRVILWGTAGAIIVRALLTGVVVWLLKIPGFLLVGGLALVYIGWKLTREEEHRPRDRGEGIVPRRGADDRGRGRRDGRRQRARRRRRRARIVAAGRHRARRSRYRSSCGARRWC